MKTTFDDIIIGALEREGGFVNHKNDRGGATNFGITLKTLQAHGIDVNADGQIDTTDVKELSLETAKKLYKKHFWDPARCEELPEEIREFYFDCVINHGQTNAVIILQNACFSHTTLHLDGIIGPDTINAAQKVNLSRLVLYRIEFYVKIVKRDATQAVFLKGWITNRCLDFLP